MIRRSTRAARPAVTRAADHRTACHAAMRMPVCALAALAAVAALASGCAADRPGGGAGPAVRDSAGIRIVDSRGPGRWSDGEPWTAAEAVSIGVVDGPEEYTFGRIMDVAALPDGSVAVLDGTDLVVKVFDADGGHLRTFGGKGGGPAEFQGVTRLALRGDTIVVHDWRLSKLAEFTLHGELIRTVRAEWLGLARGIPSRIEVVPGGLAVVVSVGCSMPPPEDRRPRWTLVTWNVEAATIDTVLSEVDPGQLAVYGQRFCTGLLSPDGRRPSLAVKPDGTAAYGDGTSYEIRIVRLSAAPAQRSVEDASMSDALALTLLRRDTPRPELTAEAIAAFRERATRPPSPNTLGDEWTRAVEAAIDSVSWPRHRGAFDALEWDDRGNLWVRRVGEEKSETADWDVFDPELTYFGAVQLPAGLTVHAIAGDMVWGTVRDDLGVNYVKGYRLRR